MLGFVLVSAPAPAFFEETTRGAAGFPRFMTHRNRLIAFCLLWRRWLPVAALACCAHCETVNAFFGQIHVAAGAEASGVRFYTLQSDLAAKYGYRGPDDTDEIDFHSDARWKTSFFYNVSSPPTPFQFLQEYPFLKYLAYSFTLNSPRTYRGVVSNYPDDGRSSIDPVQTLSYELLPLQGQLARKMDYLFEDYNGYGTLYWGYFGENWYIALGFNWGVSRYHLQLTEDRVVISDVRNQWRPIQTQSFTVGYRLGNHFERGLFSNTHIFLETVGEFTRRHAVKVELLRANGANPDPLYVQFSLVRIGIRKTIDLIPPEPPKLPGSGPAPKTEDEPPRATYPEDDARDSRDYKQPGGQEPDGSESERDGARQASEETGPESDGESPLDAPAE